ncbi:MAG: hypothetical protein EXS36_02860 [Pedosphaera sp.]|nr:hypothetical protein [Pedosphaera sp.]
MSFVGLFRLVRWVGSPIGLLIAWALVPSLALRTAAESDAQSPKPKPEIRSITPDGTNLVIVVNVPEGFRRITLESRYRIDGEARWEARELKWPDGKPGKYSFRIASDHPLEIIRIRSTDTASMPLPATFYKGKKQWNTVTTAAPEISTRDNLAVLGAAAGGSGNAPQNSPGAAPVTSEVTTPARAVVESDIWQVRDNTLYFFNQNRGLQVIDISNASAPRIGGFLPLATGGEQMYVLPVGPAGEQFVALLVRDYCNSTSSQVVIVRTDGSLPVEVARLPVTGYLLESRLVGSALYIAASDWTQSNVASVPAASSPNGSSATISTSIGIQWQYQTIVQSYNLTDPSHPTARPGIRLNAGSSAIQATDHFLFVAVNGTQMPNSPQQIAATPPWMLQGKSGIVVFDISNPNGVIQQVGSLSTAGGVADKFKMNLQGDVLAVVSQKPGYWHLSGNFGNWVGPETFLETFSLTDPAQPAKLDELSLIQNGNLFATRFDGNRAYIVTFGITDPLWIVDLSNPLKLAITGKLQVPGYSTYIQPLGNRLVAMGWDSGGPAVSLFDVSNPAKPSLLSKVFLGKWGWSEANFDEKAINILPADGLILVPWSGWNVAADGKPDVSQAPSQYFTGMQLIDLGADTLRKRGTISHAAQARRAAVHNGKVLSLSGTELLSVDISNRDHPLVTADLDLAASAADWVAVRGERLIQFHYRQAANSGQLRPARVHVSSVSDPEKRLSSLEISTQNILGLSLHGENLYILERGDDTYRLVTVTTTNKEIRAISQLPLIQFQTNEIVQTVELPPLLSLLTHGVVTYHDPLMEVLITNIFQIPLPPLPGDTNEPVFITRVFVHTNFVPVPPTLSYVTNIVVEPGLPTPITNVFVTTIELPAPQIPETNWITKTVLTPQLPRLETNIVVKKIAIPQPDLLQTNWVVYTNTLQQRTPATGQLTVVDVGQLPALAIRGRVSFETGPNYYEAALEAVWVNNETVVWTEPAQDGGFRRPFPVMSDSAAGVASAQLAPGGAAFASDARSVPFPGNWWWYWSGGNTRDVYTFNVRNLEAPIFASGFRIGGADGAPQPRQVFELLAGSIDRVVDTSESWSGFSTAFGSDGKLYFSHQTSRYFQEEGVWIGDPAAKGIWTVRIPARYEHKFYLDVVDFTIPSHPVARPVASFPGTLKGFSHRGALLYAEPGFFDVSPLDGAVAKPQLQALAYDGSSVSLVDSLYFPDTAPQPYLILPTGGVLLARPGDTHGTPSRLESWAVSGNATFKKYGTLSLGSDLVSGLHRFEAGVISETAGGDLLFLDPSSLASVRMLGRGKKPCSLWVNWPSSGASAASGLWVPRSSYGLWHIPVQP